MADENSPLRDLLSRSGFPFQLAVEYSIRTVSAKYRIEDVRREVPWAGGFLDVVAQRNEILFVFECKRVDDKSWVFLISDDGKERQNRCRLEWFNGSAPMPNKRLPGHSRVFCCEYNAVEPSPESDFCVMPKRTPIGSLESVCRDLLAGCHDLLANEEITHGKYAVAVPVVITTANLYTCRLDPAVIPLNTGKLGVSDGQFTEVNWVRFRKSLVTTRSNSYDSSEMVLKNWAADRERTVFVLTPSALETFLHGFREFSAMDNFHGGLPPELRNPPTLKES